MRRLGLSAIAYKAEQGVTEPVMKQYRYRSPIYMPRWASRLTLVVTATKIERVQEITEEDAKAEGVEARRSGQWGDGEPTHAYRTGFVYVWRDLHGPDSWIANPQVVALTFTVQHHNIDARKRADG